jgi:ATP-binding cassette subfamily B protein
VDDERKGPTVSVRSSWLRGFVGDLHGQRRWLAVLVVLVPLDVLRQIAAPELLRRFIDVVLTAGRTDRLAGLALAFLGLAVVGQVLSVASGYLAARVAWTVTNRLRTRLVGHCLRQDSGFHLRHSPGVLVDRIDGDVTQLAGLLSGLLLEVVAQGLLIVGILIALLFLDWRYAALFAPFALVMLLLLRRLAGRALPMLTARRQANAELLGFVEEGLTGVEDARANGAGAHLLDGLWRRLLVHYDRARRAARAAVSWPATIQAVAVVNFSAALALGVWLYGTGRVSLGTVFAGLSYSVLLRMPLMSITGRFKDLQDVVVSVNRINQLLDEGGRVRDGGGTLPPGPKEVRFEAVRFAYDDEPVLADVSFTVPAGRAVALVGRTGGGKSTVLRLLFRQYDPDAGVIRIGGRDLRELNVAAVRARVALVTQDVHVLPGTLRDNLTFFDPSVPDTRLVEVLTEVGLDGWYAGLPDGLDTVLGPGATGLSAGQEQLVALARGLLADPDVVLLDEPSARLDPHTEQALHLAIRRFVRGRTAIIVAHRAETLRTVDEVLRIEGGRVVGPQPAARGTGGAW